MRALSVGALCMLLSACGAGSNFNMRVKEINGEIKVEPATGKSYDYLVTIRNLREPGFDPDIKADRDQAALAFLEKQCPRGRIVGESEIVTGEAALVSRIAKNYYLQVKC